jgi:hypothetical protein
MNTPSYSWLAVLLLSTVSVPAAAAAPAAIVEGLQAPAWVERAGTKSPLKQGMTLQSGDKVLTGPQSRALLRLEEGSQVKLGENGQVNLDELNPPEDSGGLFKGVLGVLKGAFRFTTTALGARRQRNMNITVGTVTAGIRGTDLWGKSGDDKDIVCLIEGRIGVERGSDKFEMSDPLSFYIAPRNAPALPVAPVEPAQLKQWAQETELQASQGVQSSGGEWSVVLMSLNDAGEAEARMRPLHDAGYAVETRSAEVNGRTWTRLVLPGFATARDARAVAQRLQGVHGLGTPWVTRG